MGQYEIPEKIFYLLNVARHTEYRICKDKWIKLDQHFILPTKINPKWTKGLNV